MFYGSSPYVAAYAHVIILPFHLSLQIVGLNFFLLVVTCLKKPMFCALVMAIICLL